jgi:hypothetical protein
MYVTSMTEVLKGLTHWNRGKHEKAVCGSVPDQAHLGCKPLGAPQTASQPATWGAQEIALVL